MVAIILKYGNVNLIILACYIYSGLSGTIESCYLELYEIDKDVRSSSWVDR